MGKRGPKKRIDLEAVWEMRKRVEWKLANHRAAVAHFNLVKMHSSIRMTPAMKAGLTNRILGVGEMLSA